MFICNLCLAKGYLNGESLFKSSGRCEDCGKTDTCNDIPSGALRPRSAPVDQTGQPMAVKAPYTVPFQSTHDFVTKDMVLALHQAWNEFVTRFSVDPAFIILSEQAWLQLQLSDESSRYRMEVFGGSSPATYRGKAFAVSQAAPAPIEMVGKPGSLQSVVLTWASAEGQ